MIVSKTPLRISFFGGGSDIPDYYDNNSEGLVLSTTINSYIYIALNKCVADHLKVVYSQIEHTTNVEDIAHDRVRETLKFFEINSNIEICSFSDVNTKGTGLGSSSSFTVGLVNALWKLIHHKNMEKWDLAETASYIEMVKCVEPIGKQDQFAAAYGGLNAIQFCKDGAHVRKVKVPQHTIYDLQHSLFLFNTGLGRKTGDILVEQKDVLKEGTLTKSLVEMAKQAIKMLETNKLNDFGDLLDASWTVKKSLSESVTNPHIDEMYELALEGGALGGKILGAGGGGYLLVYCPEKCRGRMLETMRNYERLPFKFSTEGSTIEMTS